MNGIKDEIRKQCTEIINAFAYFVDHREFEKAAALFAEDAVFERPEGSFCGREEILALFKKRPENVVTRHLLCPPFFVSVGSEEVKAVTQLTLYHAEKQEEGIPTISKPIGIAEFQDTLVLTQQGWKIADRRGMPVLLFK